MATRAMFVDHNANRANIDGARHRLKSSSPARRPPRRDRSSSVRKQAIADHHAHDLSDDLMPWEATSAATASPLPQQHHPQSNYLASLPNQSCSPSDSLSPLLPVLPPSSMSPPLPFPRQRPRSGAEATPPRLAPQVSLRPVQHESQAMQHNPQHLSSPFDEPAHAPSFPCSSPPDQEALSSCRRRLDSYETALSSVHSLPTSSLQTDDNERDKTRLTYSRSTSRGSHRSASRGPNRSISRGPNRSTSRGPSRSSSRGPSRSSSRSSSRDPNRSISRGSSRGSSRTTNRNNDPITRSTSGQPKHAQTKQPQPSKQSSSAWMSPPKQRSSPTKDSHRRNESSSKNKPKKYEAADLPSPTSWIPPYKQTNTKQQLHQRPKPRKTSGKRDNKNESRAPTPPPPSPLTTTEATATTASVSDYGDSTNYLDNIFGNHARIPQPAGSSSVNRSRATTIDSVMAVISMSSTAKSVAPNFSGKKQQQQEHHFKDANVIVHGGANGDIEASMVLHHDEFADDPAWENENRSNALPDTTDEDDYGRSSKGRAKLSYNCSPVREIFPTSSSDPNKDYHDDSSVSSLSDDDDDDDDLYEDSDATANRGKGTKTLPGLNKKSGARAMAAILKTPRALANKTMKGNSKENPPTFKFTARDTETTAATSAVGSTARTLETIDDSGRNFRLTTIDGTADTADNPVGTRDELVSQRAFHRRVKSSGSGYRHYQRSSTDGSGGYNSSLSYQQVPLSPTHPRDERSPALSRRPNMILPKPHPMEWGSPPPIGKEYPCQHAQNEYLTQTGPGRPPVIPLSPTSSCNKYGMSTIPRVGLNNPCENSVGSGISSNGWSLHSARDGTNNPSASDEVRSQPMLSSSNRKLSPRKPPKIMNRSKSAQDVQFDPMSPGIGTEAHSYAGGMSIGSSCCSPMRPSPGPPRHLRDDPLLSNSRYRSPLMAARRRKSNSGRSSRQRSRRMIQEENCCMMGTIALSETSVPMSPLDSCCNGSRKSIRSHASHSIDCGMTNYSLSSYASTSDLALHMSPAAIAAASVASANGEYYITDDLNQSTITGISDCEDDESSCESFREEFLRRRRGNVVKKEVKHLMGKVFPNPKPVVDKMGRKLLGKPETKKNSLMRADGCLT